MGDRLYVEPDCGAHVPHAGKCTLCGAVLQHRWLRQVEIDYKAAYTAYDEHGSNMSDPSLAALRAAIDAALGIGGDDE